MAITVMLEFSVLVERAEEFKILLRELLPDTRSYEGCLRVDVYQGHDNPGIIYLVEDWNSKEHQQKYQSWRNESGIAEVVGPYLAEEPQFHYFDKQNI